MEIIIETLRSIAYAITQPSYVLLLIILGIIFYRKNKRISVMQKMIVGDSINSPMELTVSQIVLGIIGGAVGSIILTYLGIAFEENSAIYLIFLISILLTFVNPRFICFSYSGAILGVISLGASYLEHYLNIQGIEIFSVNIISLMSLVGVLHIIEGFLVAVDGYRGAIPVFANRKESIIGGFALKRQWALPISLMFIMSSSTLDLTSVNIDMPNWWPLLKGTIELTPEKIALALMPLYAVIGYNSVTFTKGKRKKSITSGLGIIIYGITLIFIAQLVYIHNAFSIFVILYAPLAHELMIRMERYSEAKGHAKYISGNEGLMVLEVAPNSPAKEIGMESGDLLVEINDKKIGIEQDVFEVLSDIPSFMWLKVKKHTGEIKEFNYNKLVSGRRLGAIFVPKKLPSNDKVLKYDKEKFQDILDKFKNNDKE